MRLSVGRMRGFAVVSALLLVALVTGALASTASARKILVYVGKNSADVSETYSLFAQAAGVTPVRAGDDQTALPGNLSPYSCVMLHVNQNNFLPSELLTMQNYLAAGGRLVAVGEYGGVNPYSGGAPIGVMNQVAAAVGSTMSLSNNQFEPFATTTNNILTPDRDAAKLTDSVSTIYYGGTAQLNASGSARVLFRTQLGGVPIVGAQKIGNGQFVLVGDSNVVANDVPQTNAGFTAPNANGQFAKNLCGDKTPPQVVIQVPVQNKRYKLGSTHLASYQCLDTEGTNDIASCTGPVAVGQPIDTTGTPGSTVAKTFTVDGVDDSGLTASATATYYVDDNPPDITITTPTNNGAPYSQGQTVLADFGCTDDDPAPVTVTGTVGKGFPIDTQNTGSHTFTVTCTDDAGNVSTKTHTYTVVDNTPPTITINRPANPGHYKLNQQISADFSCVDEDGPGDIPTTPPLGPQPVGPVPTGSNFDTSSPGTKTFTVTCKDKDGNLATKTHSYYVDGTPPTVIITAPIDNGAYKLGAAVPAAYTCTDDDPPYASLVGTVSVGVNINTATAGSKPFTVTCTDQAGNVTQKTVNYLVDDTPPAITVVAPGQQARYRLNQAVPANYICNDNDALKPGEPKGFQVQPPAPDAAVPVGANFSTTPATAPLTKTFKVTCEDRAGNIATKLVDYVVDDSKPDIDITVPTQGARYQIGAPITTAFTCTDDDGPFDIAFCKGPGGISSGGPLDTAGVSGQVVEKDFLVTTSDIAGNTNTKSLTYLVDGNPPQITITTPANGGRYIVGQSLKADYTCTDDHPLPAPPTGTVAVGAQVDVGTAGEKTFTVTCTDDVGNSASKTATYRVVGNNPPKVDITSPKDGATFAQNSTIALNFACSDPDGQDDLAKCARVGASGPLDSSKAGTFAVTVEAVDLEGNRATKTHNYTVTGKPAAAASPTTSSSTKKKACSSRRQFRIRVKKTKKKQKLRIVRVSVTVNGKRTQVKKGKRVTAVVTLKGLPKGRYRVVIRAKLSNGRTITDVRRFRTCTPKGRT